MFVPSGHWLWSCSLDYCERGSTVCNESGLLQVTFSVLSFNESYGVWCVCVLTCVMCVAWMLVAVGLYCCINHCCSSQICIRLFMWACPVFSKISYIVYTHTSLLQVCAYPPSVRVPSKCARTLQVCAYPPSVAGTLQVCGYTQSVRVHSKCARTLQVLRVHSKCARTLHKRACTL